MKKEYALAFLLGMSVLCDNAFSMQPFAKGREINEMQRRDVQELLAEISSLVEQGSFSEKDVRRFRAALNLPDANWGSTTQKETWVGIFDRMSNGQNTISENINLILAEMSQSVPTTVVEANFDENANNFVNQIVDLTGSSLEELTWLRFLTGQVQQNFNDGGILEEQYENIMLLIEGKRQSINSALEKQGEETARRLFEEEKAVFDSTEASRRREEEDSREQTFANFYHRIEDASGNGGKLIALLEEMGSYESTFSSQQYNDLCTFLDNKIEAAHF
ncbi:MAG: hypothetical protein LBQ08_03145 [Holosporaceae bacterium]|jgi:hypothetical protein|nr:hypothetical protein [Holosporaceae bacterium]